MRYHPPVEYDPEELKWEAEEKKFNRFLIIISVAVCLFFIFSLKKFKKGLTNLLIYVTL